jgi:hypothetical protein
MSRERLKLKQRQLVAMRTDLRQSGIAIVCSDGMVEIPPMNEVVDDLVRLRLERDWEPQAFRRTWVGRVS